MLSLHYMHCLQRDISPQQYHGWGYSSPSSGFVLGCNLGAAPIVFGKEPPAEGGAARGHFGDPFLLVALPDMCHQVLDAHFARLPATPTVFCDRIKTTGLNVSSPSDAVANERVMI